MALAMSSFNIKLFKILAKEKTHKVEVWLVHFCPWLSNIDHGGVGEEVLVVPNLQNGCPVGG